MKSLRKLCTNRNVAPIRPAMAGMVSVPAVEFHLAGRMHRISRPHCGGENKHATGLRTLAWPGTLHPAFDYALSYRHHDFDKQGRTADRLCDSPPRRGHQ